MSNSSGYAFIVATLESIPNKMTKEKFKEAWRLHERAIKMVANGQPAEALRLDQEALTKFEQIPNTRALRALCHGNMGGAYYLLGNFHKSLEASRLALSGLEETPELQDDLATCLCIIGTAYFALDEREKGLESLRRASAIWSSIGQENKAAQCRKDIASVERMMRPKSGFLGKLFGLFIYMDPVSVAILASLTNDTLNSIGNQRP